MIMMAEEGCMVAQPLRTNRKTRMPTLTVKESRLLCEAGCVWERYDHDHIVLHFRRTRHATANSKTQNGTTTHANRCNVAGLLGRRCVRPPLLRMALRLTRTRS